MNKLLYENFNRINLNLSNEYDVILLTQKNEYFVDLDIHLSANSAEFKYNVEGLKPFDAINKFDYQMKYRLLYSVGNLRELNKKFKFPLTPNNLYFDDNFIPKVKFRDIYSNLDIYNDELFLYQYKCLIASVIYPNYSFDDYFNGGLDILLDPKESIISTLTTVEEIKESISLKLRAVDQEVNDNYISINKNIVTKYKVLKYTFIVFVFLFMIAISIGGYSIHKTHQQNNLAILYINEDYSSVVETTRELNQQSLTDWEKKIICISYIKTSALEENQKKGYIDNLNETKNVEFWINLVFNNFDEAISIASNIENSKLEKFALQQYKDYLLNDSSLSEKDKAQKIKEIENKLKQLE